MGVEIKEQVSASRKLGEERARELIAGASKVYVAKGKKLEEFSGQAANDELVGKMLGTTGNLRAPAVVFGKQVLIGFNEELYRKVIG